MANGQAYTTTVWDERKGKWCVFQDGSAALWWLDFACTQWESETTDGGLTPKANSGSGTYGRFGRLPGLGFYLVETDGRLLFRRDPITIPSN